MLVICLFVFTCLVAASSQQYPDYDEGLEQIPSEYQYETRRSRLFGNKHSLRTFDPGYRPFSTFGRGFNREVNPDTWYQDNVGSHEEGKPVKITDKYRKPSHSFKHGHSLLRTFDKGYVRDEKPEAWYHDNAQYQEGGKPTVKITYKKRYRNRHGSHNQHHQDQHGEESNSNQLDNVNKTNEEGTYDANEILPNSEFEISQVTKKLCKNPKNVFYAFWDLVSRLLHIDTKMINNGEKLNVFLDILQGFNNTDGKLTSESANYYKKQHEQVVPLLQMLRTQNPDKDKINQYLNTIIKNNIQLDPTLVIILKDALQNQLNKSNNSEDPDWIQILNYFTQIAKLHNDNDNKGNPQSTNYETVEHVPLEIHTNEYIHKDFNPIIFPIHVSHKSEQHEQVVPLLQMLRTENPDKDKINEYLNTIIKNNIQLDPTLVIILKDALQNQLKKSKNSEDPDWIQILKYFSQIANLHNAYDNKGNLQTTYYNTVEHVPLEKHTNEYIHKDFHPIMFPIHVSHKSEPHNYVVESSKSQTFFPNSGKNVEWDAPHGSEFVKVFPTDQSVYQKQLVHITPLLSILRSRRPDKQKINEILQTIVKQNIKLHPTLLLLLKKEFNEKFKQLPKETKDAVWSETLHNFEILENESEKEFTNLQPENNKDFATQVNEYFEDGPKPQTSEYNKIHVTFENQKTNPIHIVHQYVPVPGESVTGQNKEYSEDFLKVLPLEKLQSTGSEDYEYQEKYFPILIRLIKTEKPDYNVINDVLVYIIQHNIKFYPNQVTLLKQAVNDKLRQTPEDSDKVKMFKTLKDLEKVETISVQNPHQSKPTAFPDFVDSKKIEIIIPKDNFNDTETENHKEKVSQEQQNNEPKNDFTTVTEIKTTKTYVTKQTSDESKTKPTQENMLQIFPFDQTLVNEDSDNYKKQKEYVLLLLELLEVPTPNIKKISYILNSMLKRDVRVSPIFMLLLKRELNKRFKEIDKDSENEDWKKALHYFKELENLSSFGYTGNFGTTEFPIDLTSLQDYVSKEPGRQQTQGNEPVTSTTTTITTDAQYSTDSPHSKEDRTSYEGYDGFTYKNPESQAPEHKDKVDKNEVLLVRVINSESKSTTQSDFKETTTTTSPAFNHDGTSEKPKSKEFTKIEHLFEHSDVSDGTNLENHKPHSYVTQIDREVDSSFGGLNDYGEDREPKYYIDVNTLLEHEQDDSTTKEDSEQDGLPMFYLEPQQDTTTTTFTTNAVTTTASPASSTTKTSSDSYYASTSSTKNNEVPTTEEPQSVNNDEPSNLSVQELRSNDDNPTYTSTENQYVNFVSTQKTPTVRITEQVEQETLPSNYEESKEKQELHLEFPHVERTSSEIRWHQIDNVNEHQDKEYESSTPSTDDKSPSTSTQQPQYVQLDSSTVATNSESKQTSNKNKGNPAVEVHIIYKENAPQIKYSNDNETYHSTKSKDVNLFEYQEKQDNSETSMKSEYPNELRTFKIVESKQNDNNKMNVLIPDSVTITPYGSYLSNSVTYNKDFQYFYPLLQLIQAPNPDKRQINEYIEGILKKNVKLNPKLILILRLEFDKAFKNVDNNPKDVYLNKIQHHFKELENVDLVPNIDDNTRDKPAKPEYPQEKETSTEPAVPKGNVANPEPNKSYIEWTGTTTQNDNLDYNNQQEYVYALLKLIQLINAQKADKQAIKLTLQTLLKKRVKVYPGLLLLLKYTISEKFQSLDDDDGQDEWIKILNVLKEFEHVLQKNADKGESYTNEKSDVNTSAEKVPYDMNQNLDSVKNTEFIFPGVQNGQFTYQDQIKYVYPLIMQLSGKELDKQKIYAYLKAIPMDTLKIHPSFILVLKRALFKRLHDHDIDPSDVYWMQILKSFQQLEKSSVFASNVENNAEKQYFPENGEPNYDIRVTKESNNLPEFPSFIYSVLHSSPSSVEKQDHSEIKILPGKANEVMFYLKQMYLLLTQKQPDVSKIMEVLKVLKKYNVTVSLEFILKNYVQQKSPEQKSFDIPVPDYRQLVLQQLQAQYGLSKTEDKAIIYQIMILVNSFPKEDWNALKLLYNFLILLRENQASNNVHRNANWSTILAELKKSRNKIVYWAPATDNSGDLSSFYFNQNVQSYPNVQWSSYGPQGSKAMYSSVNYPNQSSKVSWYGTQIGNQDEDGDAKKKLQEVLLKLLKYQKPNQKEISEVMDKLHKEQAVSPHLEELLLRQASGNSPIIKQ